MCCHQLFCKNCMTKEWYKTFCLGHVCCHQFFCKNCMTTAWCKSFCWGQMCCHPLFCKNCKAMGCCKAIHIAHMQAGCTHGADMLCAVPRYQIQSCQKDNFRFMGCRRCQLDSFGRSRFDPSYFAVNLHPTGALLFTPHHSQLTLLQHIIIQSPFLKQPVQFLSDIPKYWLEDDGTMCLHSSHRWKSEDTIAWLRARGLHSVPNSIKAEIGDLVYNGPKKAYA